MHADLAIPSDHIALLLVDLQEEHRKDPRFLAHDYDLALRNAASLLQAARHAQVPVFHAQYVRDFAVEPPRPFEVRGEQGEPQFSDAASPLVALCPEVAPGVNEKRIIKQDASSFKKTSLAEDLTALGRPWLMVAGAWTEACVAATVRDALSLGLRVVLVKDACASGSALMHEVGILNLANRLLGGAVVDTARATALLAGRSVRAWQFTSMVPFRYTAETAAALYEDL